MNEFIQILKKLMAAGSNLDHMPFVYKRNIIDLTRYCYIQDILTRSEMDKVLEELLPYEEDFCAVDMSDPWGNRPYNINQQLCIEIVERFS